MISFIYTLTLICKGIVIIWRKKCYERQQEMIIYEPQQYHEREAAIK